MSKIEAGGVRVVKFEKIVFGGTSSVYYRLCVARGARAPRPFFQRVDSPLCDHEHATRGEAERCPVAAAYYRKTSGKYVPVDDDSVPIDDEFLMSLGFDLGTMHATILFDAPPVVPGEPFAGEVVELNLTPHPGDSEAWDVGLMQGKDLVTFPARSAENRGELREIIKFLSRWCGPANETRKRPTSDVID